ncbi:Lrp/AsnC family transcriptional regulator [Denitromonas ohlonensis]|uniref:Lrp/AsnC family transcriptional regulator n=2 Tax=Denitromonas TaxID=139331 RepID=A0A558CAG4_9RHOO|nr:Lrp/AsnC family transcriptional regulator [Denitromonas ohlonensis]TVT45786.1 MAG: Lrp/AsnC family transcriptional regulator [Denitromonas halophila]TVO63109.1 Lrp/AsnC family transcriptional regulator [Denitromonas ohlonensis]TVO73640.1 Lrp/AsnC family transcriptional regulator [Denitromonas ohlonensis]TVT71878.1 MAG: Lrp/AsnC family transcriptional regulator [Denitromonas halophila]TVT77031.1 MAG: Lrp/AsnC family transcriptional regulator [Denitromonas halophila]
MALDRIDRRILSILQRDARLTNQKLAEVIGLSPPACLKRVKRMTEQGYISRQVVLLDPARIGPLLHIVVEVTMERDRKDLYQRFLGRAMAHAAVKQCYQVTGEIDFVLIVVVPTMEAYDQFCDEVLYADDNLRKFRTLVSRFRNKFDTALDVGA